MTPQQLQQLYEGFQQQVNSQDQLPFISAAATLQLPGIASAYTQIVPDKQLIIDKAALSMPDADTILIKGTTDSFTFAAAPSEIRLHLNQSILYAQLDLAPVGQQLGLPGVGWFAVKDPAFMVTAPESPLPVTGWVSGKIEAGTTLEVRMAFPIVDNKWLFQGDFLDPYPSISNFFQLVGGVNLTTLLPQPFSTLTDLGLKEIDILYDATASSISYFGLTISTSPTYQWQLLPKLAVTGISIACFVTAPGDPANRTVSFTITGNFTIGPAGSNTLTVSATVPNFVASVTLTEGEIQLGDLVTMFLPDVTLDLQSAITSFSMQVAPSSQSYSISCGVKADWTFLTVNNDFSLTLTALALMISSQQGSTTGQFSGTFHIGPKLPDQGVDLTVFAGYDGSGWSYGAKTGADQQISLIDIAFTFLKPFGMENLPSWVNGVGLSVSNLYLTANVPNSSTGKPATYNTGGSVLWTLNYNSFNLNLKASVDIVYSNGKTSGTIAGEALFLGMLFKVGYKFGTPDTEVYLEWEGIVCKYVHDSVKNQDIITITFGSMSLGDIITHLIASFDPGFTLSAPWKVLNSISLNGLSLQYVRNLNDTSKDSMQVIYQSNIDLGFLKVSAVTLTKDETGVYLGFEGSFLGMKIDSGNPDTAPLAGKGSEVRNMPGVPGMGDQFFNLHFLGMGQHVAFTQPQNINNIQTAITVMRSAFSDTNSQPNTVPIKPNGAGALSFDQNSHWLMGADFTVAKFYRLAAVFNDPELYGMMISVDKTAEYFGNLYFEILYKKVNDSIGVYQIDLQLPDEFRHLEFGEVSITLPLIGIKIYTNGNFYLDFGFPASITDFSRSFTVQVFPFIGAGGFYFGYLSGATATNIPTTQCGIFNPVISFGLGLQLGVGKTVDEGILKAGLYLTAVGIFQGVLAFFRPTKGLKRANGEPLTDDIYYKLQGTFGLVGHIYGEVNFAIISARVDILAYVYVSITIESYMEIPITFEAGVSVSLKVTINLGLFKIRISLSFKATVKAAFVIGENHTQDAMWNQCVLPPAAKRRRLLDTPVTLCWQPVTPDTGTTYLLDLYFIPQLTLSGDGTPGPQYSAMFYIDTADAGIANTVNGVKALATGTLYWCISALLTNGKTDIKLSWLNEQEVTADQLALLLCYFSNRPDNVAPFNYQNSKQYDILSFLKTFFSIKITAADPATQQDLQAAVFPALPALQLQTDYKGTKGPLVNFATQSMTGDSHYVTDITALLRMLSIDAENALTAAYYGNDCTQVSDPNYEVQPNLSMPTFMFTDFIALVAKSVLQDALDYMQDNDKTTMKAVDLVNAVITEANTSEIGGMASRFLLHGLRLPAPPDASAGAITPLYLLTGQQFPLPANLAKDEAYSVLLTKQAADTWITFNGVTGDTLTVTINNDEIQRINDMRSIVLQPSLQAGSPSAIVNYTDAPQSFTLNSPAQWHYPGEYFPGLQNPPVLWLVPANLTAVFAAHAGQALPFSIQTITPEGSTNKKGTVSQYRWGTAITITAQKITAGLAPGTPLTGNMFNLTGADDAGVILLQDLLTYIQDQQHGSDAFIDQVQLLFQPNPVDTSTGGFVSAANGAVQFAIVQANLSTETHPSMMAAKAVAATGYNTLNTPGNFVQLLWENSIVRSGGYYVYYRADDGSGLPDYLFNEDGTAMLTLVITYKTLPVESFVNSVITGDGIDTSKTSVYAQSANIITRIASIPAGTVGYSVLRNNPGEYNPAKLPPTIAEDQVYLQNQFNLLGALLPGISAYQNLLPTGPADSLDDQQIADLRAGKTLDLPEDTWNYSAVIPYYKYVQASGTDKDYPNPYAGTGTTVQMQLNWQDMFGNMPMSNVSPLTLGMALLYTDQIAAVSQWPSMSVYYQFGNPDGTPEIQLSFCFDTSRYKGDSAKDRASIDLQTYMRLYYQLGADMAMYFNCSIDGTEAAPGGSKRTIDVGKLSSELVQPIIAYLKGILAGSSVSGVPVPYTLTSAVQPSTIAAYSDTFPLTLSVTMERTAHVDPAFAQTPGVASAGTTVPPQSQGVPCGQTADTDSGYLSLTPFAQLFEAAFKDQPTKGILLKVAAGTQQAGPDNLPALWVVRMDSTGASGIRYTFDNSAVFYYAPIPLANTLLTFNAGISPYSSGKAYPSGAAVTQHFSSIDLDSWGLQFLEAADAFLSPAYAVPAFLLDNGVTLQKVLDQKQQLAEAIEGTIDYIITPGSTAKANIGNAQDKWKQLTLIALANAYRYTAAVQTPVTINSGWEGSNNQPPEAPYVPQLYGSMKGTDPSLPITDPASTEYTLSTAKVPLGNGPSWLTYMFEARDMAASRSFSFKQMRYNVSHIERDIHTVPGITGYLASSWLTFIIPLDPLMGDIGPVDIPVPLRAYPTPPSILSQASEYPVNDGAVPPITISQVRTWNYRYTYQNLSAAQDTIHTQVQFNVPLSNVAARRKALDDTPTLDQALAQFMAVYDAIHADFLTYLLPLTAQDVQDNNSTAQAANNAVQAFLTIVSGVATAWSNWNQVNPRKAVKRSNAARQLPLADVTLSYIITESAQTDTERLLVTVIADAGNPLAMMPAVDIDGYTAEAVSGADNTYVYKNKDGDYLLFADRNTEPDRTVRMTPLDILQLQNSWAGASVIRNQYLLQDRDGQWLPTNPRFIYQTPWIRFYDRLIPLLSSNQAVDVSTINSNIFPAPQVRTMLDNITQLFAALMQDVSADLLIKFHAEYQYTMANAAFNVQLPVLLLPSATVTAKDHGAAMTAIIAGALDLWLKGHDPESNAGQFTFALTVFSDDNSRPVLQVPLYLLLSNLSD